MDWFRDIRHVKLDIGAMKDKIYVWEGALKRDTGGIFLY